MFEHMGLNMYLPAGKEAHLVTCQAQCAPGFGAACLIILYINSRLQNYAYLCMVMESLLYLMCVHSVLLQKKKTCQVGLLRLQRVHLHFIQQAVHYIMKKV